MRSEQKHSHKQKIDIHWEILKNPKQIIGTGVFKAARSQAVLTTGTPRRASIPFPVQSLIQHTRAQVSGRKTAYVDSVVGQWLSKYTPLSSCNIS